VYDPDTARTTQRTVPFVARPQAFAVKIPGFFVSGLPTALAAPIMLVGLETYTDLLNIGIVFLLTPKWYCNLMQEPRR